MPVELKIYGDNAEALVAEFRKLNALTAYEAALDTDVLAVVKSLPLDEMINLVRERMRDEGFKLEIIDQREPEPQAEAAVEPEPASKPRGRPRKTNGATPEVITEPGTAADEDITLPRSKKASKAPSVPLDAESEPDPAGDRQHVLDTLASILKDPKQKDRVLGFASGMAKQHGKDKISELPVDPFPEIRRAMEKEFSNV